jgi:signal transduction histidine kinase
MQPVLVYDVILSLEAMVEPELRKRQLTFSHQVPEPNLVAWADPEKLRQILLNLLANGMKFTPEGGRISIGAERDGDKVRMWVSDTGIGIPSEQLQQVFDPFFQVERGPTRRYSGVGLGLSISRDLARAMKGALWLESTPGQGSTAWLILPVA